MLSGIGWPAVAASLSLVATAIAVAWALGLGVGRDIATASARAAVQLLAVGLVFAPLFSSSFALLGAWIWVCFMAVVAFVVIMRRTSGIGSRRTVALPVGLAVVGSTALSIVVVFGFGVIDFEPVALVVIAGITIGNAVPITVLGANQAVAVSRNGIGQLEAALSLGFERWDAVHFFGQTAARSTLIPQIERTRVVGLIALPGAMTGLLLGGVDPIDAVVIQLLVMYLVLGSAAVCVVTIVTAVVWAAVTPDLRPADWLRPDRGEESASLA
jgi:putative ABC transport system permease protein